MAKLTKFGVLLVKRFLIVFGILTLILATTHSASADRRGFINTVVIDPGHGGRDPGAIGRNSKEKDINLAISLKLGEYIKENMPDVKVIYTREKDESVELFRRAQIANQNNADLFISIHCNSHRNTNAYGTETFVMGLSRSEANLEVARKENASILYEEDYMDTYDGFDPHSPEANIIFSLYQNAYLDQSLVVASHIQNQFRERAQRVDRGVKQAEFLVLYQITMPGILVEAGFLSNPREEQYLMSDMGQLHIASAIYRAFREYKEQQDALATARKDYLTAQTVQSDKPADNQIVTDILKEQDNYPETTNNKQLLEINPTGDKISFKVQLAVSSQKIQLDAPRFKGIKALDYYYHEGLYKYTTGDTKTLEEAVILQQEMQRAGFKDAFVVAFLNEERISPEEAIRLMNMQSSNP